MAGEDASIARVLREICALDSAVRRGRARARGGPPADANAAAGRPRLRRAAPAGRGGAADRRACSPRPPGVTRAVAVAPALGDLAGLPRRRAVDAVRLPPRAAARSMDHRLPAAAVAAGRAVGPAAEKRSRPARGGRLALGAADYTIQSLYHGCSLFLLPAYWASTTLDSRNVAFFLLLVGMVLLATFDPWYRAAIKRLPAVVDLFFLVAVFAALNVALPLVGVAPFRALLLSAWIAVVGADARAAAESRMAVAARAGRRPRSEASARHAGLRGDPVDPAGPAVPRRAALARGVARGRAVGARWARRWPWTTCGVSSPSPRSMRRRACASRSRTCGAVADEIVSRPSLAGAGRAARGLPHVLAQDRDPVGAGGPVVGRRRHGCRDSSSGGCASGCRRERSPRAARASGAGARRRLATFGAAPPGRPPSRDDLDRRAPAGVLSVRQPTRRRRSARCACRQSRPRGDAGVPQRHVPGPRHDRHRRAPGAARHRGESPLRRPARGRWYEEAADLRAPTLWDAARGAGLTTAAVSWPVTLGARIDWLLPERDYYRRAAPVELLRQATTPGLLERLGLTPRPEIFKNIVLWDEFLASTATGILRGMRPNLLLLHWSRPTSSSTRAASTGPR